MYNWKRILVVGHSEYLRHTHGHHRQQATVSPGAAVLCCSSLDRMSVLSSTIGMRLQRGRHCALQRASWRWAVAEPSAQMHQNADDRQRDPLQLVCNCHTNVGGVTRPHAIDLAVQDMLAHGCYGGAMLRMIQNALIGVCW